MGGVGAWEGGSTGGSVMGGWKHWGWGWVHGGGCMGCGWWCGAEWAVGLAWGVGLGQVCLNNCCWQAF